MLKLRVLWIALMLLASQAQAAFVSATWGTVGVDLQQSFSRLQANARAVGDEQAINPLPIPYSGTLAVDATPVGDWVSAHAAETYSLAANALQVDMTRLDRNGPAGSISNGAWLFAVTDAVRTLASGILTTDSESYFTENILHATLTDLTAGQLLFDSLQQDHLDDATYLLGGLAGSRASTFVGSLENVLLPGHVYRLTYTVGVSTGEAAADGSRATGRITLSSVSIPEPGALGLVGAALLALLGCSVSPRQRR